MFRLDLHVCSGWIARLFRLDWVYRNNVPVGKTDTNDVGITRTICPLAVCPGDISGLFQNPHMFSHCAGCHAGVFGERLLRRPASTGLVGVVRKRRQNEAGHGL